MPSAAREPPGPRTSQRARDGRTAESEPVIQAVCFIVPLEVRQSHSLLVSVSVLCYGRSDSYLFFEDDFSACCIHFPTCSCGVLSCSV